MENFGRFDGKTTSRLQQEVRDFAFFLSEKKVKPKRRKLRLNWAGGLREFRDKYTSLELQTKSMDCWGD